MAFEEVRHQVAIAGRVTDGQTGRAIAAARVRIDSGPPEFDQAVALRRQQFGQRWDGMLERLDGTSTAADGHFHFLDLPAGTYALSVSLPGSGTRFTAGQTEAVVQHDSEGNITMAKADMALSPTTLQGQITDAAGQPVPLANVQLKGSAEKAFSNAQGSYRLSGLETGSRSMLVRARGFQEQTRIVQLPAVGSIQTEDFTLNTKE